MPFWEEGAVINASYKLTKRSWKNVMIGKIMQSIKP
jgi:hypothetical protein